MEDERVKRIIETVLDRLECKEEIAISAHPDDYILTESNVLYDLLIFADEVFDADSTCEGNALIVRFRNGQNFRIGVEEIF